MGFLILLTTNAQTIAQDVDRQEPGRQRAEHPSSEKLVGLLREARQLVGAPGAIFAVQYADQSIVSVADGVANIATQRKMRSTDSYYVGSISKMFTAVVILQLAEEGRLSTDDSLGRFLPSFPRAADIKLHHMLNHTSGISDFALYAYYRPQDEMMKMLTRKWTKTELVEKTAELKPFFSPGERCAYSNGNYLVLAAVVENAARNTFAAEVRKRIIDRLGLEQTWMKQFEKPRGRVRMAGYIDPTDWWPNSKMFGELGDASAMDGSYLEWGSGGIVSTLKDQLRFMRALREAELIGKSSLRKMKDYKHLDGAGETAASDQVGYGMGLMPDEQLKRLRGFGIDLEEESGADHHLLPVPSVFLIDQEGVIRFRYFNPDYKVRIDNARLLEAARRLAAGIS